MDKVSRRSVLARLLGLIVAPKAAEVAVTPEVGGTLRAVDVIPMSEWRTIQDTSVREAHKGLTDNLVAYYPMDEASGPPRMLSAEEFWRGYFPCILVDKGA